MQCGCTSVSKGAVWGLTMEIDWARHTFQKDCSTDSEERGQARTQMNLGEIIAIVEISAPPQFLKMIFIDFRD